MCGSAGHLASMAKAPHRERCDDSGAREGCAGRFEGSNIRTSLPCHLLMTIVVCGGGTSRIFVLDAQSRTDTQTQQRVCVEPGGLGDAHYPHHFLLPVFAVCAVLGSLRLARLALGACTLFEAKFTVFKVYVNLLHYVNF